MTKEKFKQEIVEFSGIESVGAGILLEDILRRFFDSNVCVPKGENRVKFADELHLMLEGADTEMQLDGFIPWIRCTINNIRIKPSEPVYEWQWIEKRNHDGEITAYTGDRLTENEAMAKSIYPPRWQKNEETKRERK